MPNKVIKSLSFKSFISMPILNRTDVIFTKSFSYFRDFSSYPRVSLSQYQWKAECSIKEEMFARSIAFSGPNPKCNSGGLLVWNPNCLLRLLPQMNSSIEEMFMFLGSTLKITIRVDWLVSCCWFGGHFYDMFSVYRFSIIDFLILDWCTTLNLWIFLDGGVI